MPLRVAVGPQNGGGLISVVRAAYVDASLPDSSAMEQATVAARILGIALDEITVLDDHADLARGVHSLGPRHLSNRVRQEEQTLRSGRFVRRARGDTAAR